MSEQESSTDTTTDTDTTHADEANTTSGTDAEGNESAERADPTARDVRYRERLRETEAERDQLRDRLRARDRADVERIAADDLDRPADAWLVWGDDPDRFLDTHGDIDTDAVREAVTELLRERPAWRKRVARRGDPDQGKGNGQTDTGQGWLGVVRRGR